MRIQLEEQQQQQGDLTIIQCETKAYSLPTTEHLIT